MSQQGIVRIGTSGIVVPGTKQSFPNEFKSGSRLHYYASLFNTLEINSSFYKVPMPSTFAKWAGEVPEDFRFTLKLWRGITHSKKLVYPIDAIAAFMAAANQLGDKRGCLLIQFPASITYSYQKEVETLLLHVQQLNESGPWRIAIEIRHISWHLAAAYKMFAKYHASLVFHDMPASKTPTNYPGTELIYLRFHGPTGDYRGSYSDKHLRQCASRVQQWCNAGQDVYIYFNNTMGAALQNAQDLQRFIVC